MYNHRIKAIIFDLGNVLIDFDHWIAARKILPFTDKTEKEIFELFFDSQLTGLFEEGKISAQEFFLKVKGLLNLKLDYEAFVPIWNEIFFFTEDNFKVCELALSLKDRYKLAVLSNINILHLEHIKRTFPIFNTFPYIVTSFELGLRKPSPLLYQKTLGMLGVSSGETFYTDDRPELIESAKGLGIRGFVFRDIEQLKKDLIGSSIIIGNG